MLVNLGSKDFLGILPEIILAVFGIYLMAQGVFIPSAKKKIVGYLGLLGIGLAIVGNLFLVGQK